MNITMANHNNARNPKNFINYDGVEFENIPEIVTSDVAYCACKLVDNYRLDSNFDGNVDLLIVDVDEKCSIEQARILFKKFKYFIVTTKSHQKNKGGLTCDRFRIFFKLEMTINIRQHIEELYNKFIKNYDFVDSSCKNCSRLFFSSPSNAIVIYNDGIEYPVRIMETGVEAKVIKKETVGMAKKSGWLERPENVEISFGETSQESKLKGIEIFLESNYYQGNKSNCLFQTSSMMKSDGFDEDFIVNYLLKYWESKKGGDDKFKDAKQNICNAFKY